jgi:apolipoprotein N-acyltransferase
MLAQLRRRPLLLALIAGLVSPVGFAPLDLWPLLLVSLALLLWLVHEAASLKRALLIGWIFGVAHFTVGNNWIKHAFDYQDKMPPVLGYFAVVLLSLYLAIYPAMAAGLAWKFGRSGERAGAPYVLIFAAAWIVTEWLRGGMFTGYPWNPLAVTWLPVPVAPQAAALVGTYALSGLTVLVAGALLLAVHRRWIAAAGSAAVLPLLGAVAMLFTVPIETTSVSKSAPPPPQVVVVQPNIGQEGVNDDDYAERVFSKLIALSGGPTNRRRLIVWPEGMVNYYIEPGYPVEWYWQGTSEMVRRRIAALLGPDDVALVSGNAIFFPPDNTGIQASGAGNSVFVVDDSAAIRARYDKAHLVPYGEYLPMRPLLEPLGLARLVMGDLDFVPGPGPRSLGVAGFGKVGMQVCYEIIFSGHVVDSGNRPDMIFNPSNDAWFGSWGPPQHLAQARLRAIEEGLPILRATPTGISAVIDANGRLLASIPQGEEGAIAVDMPPPHAPTLFARLGNWMLWLVAAAMIGAAIAIRRSAR